MPDWTPQQEQAILLNNRNLLVSAAAGSGKTAVLTERIARKVSENIDVDRLLIITFTKAAAQEMRERISAAISDMIDKGEGDVNRLVRQQALMSKATICTIDGFCNRVVKKNFTISGVDSSFSVGDEDELELIRQEIFDEMLEVYYESKNPSFLILADYFSDKCSDSELRKEIYDLHTFIYSLPEPYKWFRTAVDLYKIDNETDFNNSIWFEDTVKYVISRLEKSIEECENIIDEASAYNVSSFVEIMYKDIETFSAIKNSILSKKQTWNSMMGYFPVKYQKFTKSKEDDPDKLIEFDKKRKSIKENIDPVKSMFRNDISYVLSQISELRPCIEMLYTLVEDFDKRYTEEKNKRKILSFNDIEHLALKILKNKAVADEYKKMYQEIYIDEYQDTNMLQEAIINSFSKKDNVFMVGDVKQSIYAFRQACPDLFIEKELSYPSDVDFCESKPGCLVKLSKNFRSRRQVTESINNICSKIMNRNTCGVDYSCDDQLNFGATQYNSSDNNELYKSEILVCQGKITDEFTMISKEINRLIENKFPVYDKKTETTRPLEYGDVAILCRNIGKNATEIKNTIQSNGIPCCTEEKGGFYEDYDVNVILSVVRIIDNPLQDIPLLIAIRSPLFGFNENDIARIKLNNKSDYLFNSMLSMKNEKVIEFLNKYNELKEKSRSLSLSAFIWFLITETGYYDYVGCSKTGEKRQANLRLLFDRAVEFENSGKRSYYKFINHIEKIQSKGNSKINSGSEFSDGMDAVSVMTIHKSKGLEFPVVFVARCGSSLTKNGGGQKSSVYKDRQTGICMKLYNENTDLFEDSILKNGLAYHQKKNEIAEEIRILYVAMTRAKEKLYVTATVKEDIFNIRNSGISDSLIINADSYLYWFKHCANPDLWCVNYNDTDADLSEYYNYTEDDTFYSSSDSPEVKFNEWNYDYNFTNQLPAKMSVSDIKKRNLDQDVIVVSQKTGDSENNISGFYNNVFASDSDSYIIDGAEMGTLLHECLRRVDYCKIKEGISLNNIFNDLLEDMVIKGFIDNNQKKQIDIKLLENFFTSEIGKRVLLAVNVRREVPFTTLKNANEIDPLADGKISIQGIIDCCFIEDNQYVIVDYKSDNVKEDEIEKRAFSYKKQLDLYEEALEKISGIKVKEKILYFLRSGREIKI